MLIFFFFFFSSFLFFSFLSLTMNLNNPDIPDYGEDTPSILPSYQMHQAIFAKTLSVPLELSIPPPGYEQIDFDDLSSLDSSLSSVQSSTALYSVPSSTLPANSIDGEFDDSLRILENHNKLNTLASTSSINLSIELMANGCKIDPSTHEFSLNDIIDGYVIAENISTEQIPFNMFYIFLEGNSNSHSLINRKITMSNTFLQIIDVAATSSMLEAECNAENYHETSCGSETNIMQPGMRYKKRFQFRIPKSLLDSNCKHDHVSAHLDLPSTIEAPVKGTSSRNLTFQNMSISYNIHVKCISPNPETNQYSILKEKSTEIKIVPQSKRRTILENSIQKSLVKYAYHDFINRLDECIQQCKELRGLALPKDRVKQVHEKLQPNSEGELQFYTQLESFENKFTYIQLKQGLSFGKKSSKSLGEMKVEIPTKEHKVAYLPSMKYAKNQPLNEDKLKTWNVDVPVNLSFTPSSDNKNDFPVLKCAKASLITFSLSSDVESSKIPLEITHDMIFDNSNPEKNFSNMVTLKFHNYKSELYDQVRTLKTNPALSIDKLLVDDVLSLSKLRTRKCELNIENVQFSSSNSFSISEKNLVWKQDLKNKYTQSFSVHLDLTSATSMDNKAKPLPGNSFDNFCLIPSFQNCTMGRLYYINLDLHFTNGKVVSSKIPVSI